MSNQVGDCFKFLWPFHNVRTLHFSVHFKPCFEPFVLSIKTEPNLTRILDLEGQTRSKIRFKLGFLRTFLG